MTTYTVLGSGGYSRPPWGSFLGKTPQASKPPDVGSSISGGTFSKGRWHKIQDELAAERAVEALVERLRQEIRDRRKRAAALAKIEAARQVLKAAGGDVERETTALQDALEAAGNAQKVASTLAAIERRTKTLKAAIEEIEDEERAIELLLMHL